MVVDLIINGSSRQIGMKRNRFCWTVGDVAVSTKTNNAARARIGEATRNYYLNLRGEGITRTHHRLTIIIIIIISSNPDGRSH